MGQWREVYLLLGCDQRWKELVQQLLQNHRRHQRLIPKVFLRNDNLIFHRMCVEQQYLILIEILGELRLSLEEFDKNWVNYEKCYVIELMLIESDARRFIT